MNKTLVIVGGACIFIAVFLWSMKIMDRMNAETEFYRNAAELMRQNVS